MLKGTVKWFYPTKGYGFIQPQGGRRQRCVCPHLCGRESRLSSEPKCNTPADLIIDTVDQDLRECCHAMLFAFVG